MVAVGEELEEEEVGARMSFFQYSCGGSGELEPSESANGNITLNITDMLDDTLTLDIPDELPAHLAGGEEAHLTQLSQGAEFSTGSDGGDGRGRRTPAKGASVPAEKDKEGRPRHKRRKRIFTKKRKGNLQKIVEREHDEDEEEEQKEEWAGEEISGDSDHDEPLMKTLASAAAASGCHITRVVNHSKVTPLPHHFTRLDGGTGSLSISDDQPEKLRDGNSVDGSIKAPGSNRSSRMSTDSLAMPDACNFDTEESSQRSSLAASSRRSNVSIVGDDPFVMDDESHNTFVQDVSLREEPESRPSMLKTQSQQPLSQVSPTFSDLLSFRLSTYIPFSCLL
jgi:hypothetical protein